MLQHAALIPPILPLNKDAQDISLTEPSRLREMLYDAREQIAHLSEDLEDSHAAQYRANVALRSKDEQIASKAESIRKLNAELAVVRGREQVLAKEIERYQEESRRMEAEKSAFELQAQREAQLLASRMVEDWHSDWEATRVIELATEKTLHQQSVAELQAQVGCHSYPLNFLLVRGFRPELCESH